MPAPFMERLLAQLGVSDAPGLLRNLAKLPRPLRWGLVEEPPDPVLRGSLRRISEALAVTEDDTAALLDVSLSRAERNLTSGQRFNLTDPDAMSEQLLTDADDHLFRVASTARPEVAAQGPAAQALNRELLRLRRITHPPEAPPTHVPQLDPTLPSPDRINPVDIHRKLSSSLTSFLRTGRAEGVPAAVTAEIGHLSASRPPSARAGAEIASFEDAFKAIGGLYSTPATSTQEVQSEALRIATAIGLKTSPDRLKQNVGRAFRESGLIVATFEKRINAIETQRKFLSSKLAQLNRDFHERGAIPEEEYFGKRRALTKAIERLKQEKAETEAATFDPVVQSARIHWASTLSDALSRERLSRSDERAAKLLTDYFIGPMGSMPDPGARTILSRLEEGLTFETPAITRLAGELTARKLVRPGDLSPEVLGRVIEGPAGRFVRLPTSDEAKLIMLPGSKSAPRPGTIVTYSKPLPRLRRLEAPQAGITPPGELLGKDLLLIAPLHADLPKTAGASLATLERAVAQASSIRERLDAQRALANAKRTGRRPSSGQVVARAGEEVTRPAFLVAPLDSKGFPDLMNMRVVDADSLTTSGTPFSAASAKRAEAAFDVFKGRFADSDRLAVEAAYEATSGLSTLEATGKPGVWLISDGPGTPLGVAPNAQLALRARAEGMFVERIEGETLDQAAISAYNRAHSGLVDSLAVAISGAKRDHDLALFNSLFADAAAKAKGVTKLALDDLSSQLSEPKFIMATLDDPERLGILRDESNALLKLWQGLRKKFPGASTAQLESMLKHGVESDDPFVQRTAAALSEIADRVGTSFLRVYGRTEEAEILAKRAIEAQYGSVVDLTTPRAFALLSPTERATRGPRALSNHFLRALDDVVKRWGLRPGYSVNLAWQPDPVVLAGAHIPESGRAAPGVRTSGKKRGHPNVVVSKHGKLRDYLANDGQPPGIFEIVGVNAAGRPRRVFLDMTVGGTVPVLRDPSSQGYEAVLNSIEERLFARPAIVQRGPCRLDGV